MESSRHKHGFSIRSHAMYPNKYFILRNGNKVDPQHYGKGWINNKLALRNAQRKIKQLIETMDDYKAGKIKLPLAIHMQSED